MSSAYFVSPVHFAVASTLRKGLPTTRKPFRLLPLLPAINTLLRSFRLLAGHPGSSQLHRLVDLYVTGAAANVSRQSRLDLIARRPRNLLQQGFSRQEHSRRAISALRGSQIGERCLQRMKLVPFSHALDRVDLMPFHSDSQGQTRQHRAAVHEHCAASTLAQLAAVLGARESQVLAKHFQERLVRSKGYFDRLAVHAQVYVRFLRFSLALLPDRFHAMPFNPRAGPVTATPILSRRAGTQPVPGAPLDHPVL